MFPPSETVEVILFEELRILLPSPFPNPGDWTGQMVSHSWWPIRSVGPAELGLQEKGSLKAITQPSWVPTQWFAKHQGHWHLLVPSSRPKGHGKRRGGQEPFPGSHPQNSPITDGVPLPWKTKPRPLDFGLPALRHYLWSHDLNLRHECERPFQLCPLSRPLKFTWSRVNHPNGHWADIVEGCFIPMLAVI